MSATTTHPSHHFIDQKEHNLHLHHPHQTSHFIPSWPTYTNLLPIQFTKPAPPLKMLLFPQTRSTDLPCIPLSETACAKTCIPFAASTPAQTDFSCGDWWQTARCCNGTKSQSLVSDVYFDCHCQTLALTTQALVLIICLSLVAVLALSTAVFYVLRRKKMIVEAAEGERRVALEEAQEYLPR